VDTFLATAIFMALRPEGAAAWRSLSWTRQLSAVEYESLERCFRQVLSHPLLIQPGLCLGENAASGATTANTEGVGVRHLSARRTRTQ
jgi:hypothetical protein